MQGSIHEYSKKCSPDATVRDNIIKFLKGGTHSDLGEYKV